MRSATAIRRLQGLAGSIHDVLMGVPRGVPWGLVLPLLVATLLIGIGGAAFYQRLRGDIRTEAQRTLTVIGEHKRQQIESWLARTQGDVELAFSPRGGVAVLLGRWLTTGRQDAAALGEMRERMADLARVRGWDGVTLFDAQAQPVAAVGTTGIPEAAEQAPEVLNRPRIKLAHLHRTPDGEVQYAF